MAKKTLIVGAGLTGAAISSFLAEAGHGISTHIWEKARKPGGRMTSKTLSEGKFDSVDIGAQYISKKEEAHEFIYSNLVKTGVLVPLDISTVEKAHSSTLLLDHYTAPLGTSAIVQSFLDNSPGVTYHDNTRLANLSFTDGTNKWLATTEEGKQDEFDAVILTVPVPQILQLEGSVTEVIAPIVDALKDVTYSTRYVMALQYTKSEALDVLDTIPWSARYVKPDEDSRICFMSLDAKKRGIETPVDPVTGKQRVTLLIHASRDYSIENGAQVPKAEIPKDILAKVESEMQDSVKKLIPGITDASNVLMHRWLYSQVHHSFKTADGDPTPGSYHAHSKPDLILAGDAFSKYKSGFDGCMESALSVKKRLLEECSSKLE